jgi:hypothetical protein
MGGEGLSPLLRSFAASVVYRLVTTAETRLGRAPPTIPKCARTRLACSFGGSVVDALAKLTEIARPLACPLFDWPRVTITLEPV